MMKKTHKIPSPDQLRNAIYIDFEGEGKKKNGEIPMPHMVGCAEPNHKNKGIKYSCCFFFDKWQPAKNGTQGKLKGEVNIYSSEVKDFQSYFENLAEKLEAKNCFLIYWTQHEEVVLEKFLSKDLFNRIKKRFYNLHPIAKKYANKKRAFGKNDSAYKKSLEEFFSVLYEKRNPNPPFKLGAAEACRRIDKACVSVSRFKNFSEKQKGYLRDLLVYNRGDCLSTWLIAKKVGNFFTRK
jgi:hypothetical protein